MKKESFQNNLHFCRMIRNLSLSQICWKKVNSSTTVTPEKVKMVKEKTKDQSGSKLWFQQRAGHVTASRLKNVLHTKILLLISICYCELSCFHSKACMHGHACMVANMRMMSINHTLKPTWPFFSYHIWPGFGQFTSIYRSHLRWFNVLLLLWKQDTRNQIPLFMQRQGVWGSKQR